MTDDQANRVIAESLEPKPTAKAIPGQPSPLGIWRAGYSHDAYRGSGVWNYPNFFADPAMRELLLRKLVEEGFTLLITPVFDEMSGKVTGQFSIQVETTFPVNDVVSIVFDTYDRLMPLAWIKAHNLTADRLETQ